MFKLHTVASPKTEGINYLEPTALEAISLGELLVVTSGKLTKVAATASPDYVALATGTDVTIPVKRIYEDEVYETEFTADATAVTEGSKVTIASTGLGVTATTTNGVFYITEKLGTGAVGTRVRGMFRR